MVIRITDDADVLLQLLWVREAWALEPMGTDLPPRPAPLPVFVPSAQRLRRNKREWEQAWTELWFAALHHLARPRDANVWQSLHGSAPGSTEGADLLDSLTGPSWGARFDDAPFDDDYHDWVGGLSEQTIADQQVPLEQQPERRCLDALVPAWRRGLTTIITIPCPGTYAHHRRPRPSAHDLDSHGPDPVPRSPAPVRTRGRG